MQTKHVDCEIYAPPKQKERRIVTWTPEEDDILREQISIHGTENWTVIASKFKDKTTRQCRRRWYTYLNSDFKKGGWSPEEDILLCEAQKVFGNRWTEIAKVVSGRTDNAVKNRFTTLCKKRAKREALAKENSTIFTNTNNKRPISIQGSLHSASPLKKMRIPHIPNILENCNIQDVLHKDCMIRKKSPRSPFAVISQNEDKIDTMLPQHQATTLEDLHHGSREFEGFLENDDQILALKRFDILKTVLNKSNGSELSMSDMDSPSSSGSEYSTGSTILSTCVTEQIEQNQSEMCTLHENSCSQDIDTRSNNQEFNSPLQTTPLFSFLAATIPSPQFSESERHFLMKTLGIESPATNRSTNPSQPPPCRRALVHTL